MNSKSKVLLDLPYPLRVKIIQGQQWIGEATARIRLQPDFLIIGGQRCGTSSLYHSLIQHPDVRSALRKEVHFFDLHFRRGINWYRGHFAASMVKMRNKRLITGEASPYYLFYPLTPERVFALNPGIKLILLLRNPVDRAYSHYQHEVRLGTEPSPFEEAIELEDMRMQYEVEKMIRDPGYLSFSHQHFSYLSRGKYSDQLKLWRRYFQPQQMLILQSEGFFVNPEDAYEKVLGFLGLHAWMPPEFRKTNGLSYPKMAGVTRDRLNEYFEPYNSELFRLTGTKWDWR